MNLDKIEGWVGPSALKRAKAMLPLVIWVDISPLGTCAEFGGAPGPCLTAEGTGGGKCPPRLEASSVNCIYCKATVPHSGFHLPSLPLRIKEGAKNPALSSLNEEQ